MMPSLYTFTLLSAAVLLICGAPLLLAPRRTESLVRSLPRHRELGWVTMLLGGGWFLFKISQLSQADFGDYRMILFLIFAATLLGTFLYVRDFMAVRGIAILVLLSANVGLKSAFGLYDIPERLILVTILYIALSLAIFLGVAPYYARDWLDRLYRSTLRVQVLGGVLAGAGLILFITSFFY